MSGSMWDSLISSVKDFITSLEKNLNLKRNSRVSIIGHDHASQKICYKRIPQAELVNKIVFTSGDNDFDIPFKQAHHWMKKSYAQFDKFVLCFMSDGAWTYPAQAI